MLCVIVIKDNSNYFNNLKITIAMTFQIQYLTPQHLSRVK